MNLFLAPQTAPFGVAAALIVAIALVELIGLSVAMSPSDWLESMIPESIQPHTGAEGVLGWLHIGRAPLLVLLLVLLSVYTVTGYVGQIIVGAAFGAYAPAWLAGALALAPAVLSVRALVPLLARLMPRDESAAVSQDSLIGRSGTIVTGTARRGLAAEVRVTDGTGRSHFVMAEPNLDGEEIPDGTRVLLVSRTGATWRCIRDPHAHLG
jgi:membrane protein implicated in regulation of membrane protease activity